MKTIFKTFSFGIIFGLGFMMIVWIGYIIIKATRSSTNPGSDPAPNDLYVSEGEVIKASKRNALVDKSLACPTGFTAISKNGNMLGCLQTDHNATTATCNDAIQNCWNDYGGRLPYYDIAYIALYNNLVTIGSTDKSEWIGTSNLYYYTSRVRGCGLINKIDLKPTASSYTDLRYYRCFIPR